jgi:hypothetical protein
MNLGISAFVTAFSEQFPASKPVCESQAHPYTRRSHVKAIRLLALLLFFVSFVQILPVRADTGAPAQKEWTFLVFLNGHNNLDTYGTLNMQQMETVGSTADLNLVVQWASSAYGNTRRVLVQKSTDPSIVTSPVIEEMPRVDMGDYKNLVEFVRWGVQNYPAKHYFIDVWNHGNGWHRGEQGNPMRDISWDDFSGNHITTAQLGQAMREAAQIIGHKVDVYGSDACLMAMMEVSQEIADSVEVAVNSEETEAGEGWPYDTLVQRWAAKPLATAAEVGTILSEEYAKRYSTVEPQDATLSAVDLTKIGPVNTAIAALGAQIQKLSTSDRKKVQSAMKTTQVFYDQDYGDLLDFMAKLEGAKIASLTPLIANVKAAAKPFITANNVTGKFVGRALGISIWLPTSSYDWNDYKDLYKTMAFDKATSWDKVLALFF